MAGTANESAKNMNWTTDTGFLINIGAEPRMQEEFLLQYYNFLKAIILNAATKPKKYIWSGWRMLRVCIPYGEIDQVLDELTPLMLEACREFLEKRITPEFIEAIRKTHRKEAAEHHHVSVRTTLQAIFVSKLKKNTNDNIIVKFNSTSVELNLKNSYHADSWQIENLKEGEDNSCSGAKYVYTKQDVREILRRFRIMLTRMAGKGNVSVYPTPYECYCLYHDCFGTDRKKVVQAYVPNPQDQELFLKKEDWHDETVGALLAEHYKGATQTGNKRKVSCERKTVNNRRREYQELLLKCVLNYMPDADLNEIKDILDKRDLDADTVMNFFTRFIYSSGLTISEARNCKKTRTLEISK